MTMGEAEVICHVCTALCSLLTGGSESVWRIFAALG